MHRDIDTIDVIRNGTALAVRWSDGSERVVRRIDLTPDLASPADADAAASGRIHHVRRTGGIVEIDLVDGGVVAASARDLIDPADVARQLGRVDLVVETAGLVVTATGRAANPLGAIENGAVLIGGGRILWVGPADETARSGLDLSGAQHLDAEGRLITPGLVDCHAHPVFAGDRADEFARRAAGDDYRAIAEAGGGIAATVLPTRATGFDDHVALASLRMRRALGSGTTTCEAKSGYDLTVDGELRLLEIAQAVDALHVMDLSPTLLGAHALPPDVAARGAGARADYVDRVVAQMIPQAAARGLADAVDVYCDDGAFTLDEARRILQAGRDLGLAVRAHAGQFADLGVAELVAELGGLSADHLENVSAAGIAAMAKAGVVAVMLPGACVQLRLTPPPVAALRAAGVPMAVATDLNPGTSHSESLPLQMWLATTHYGMTVNEAWLGVTRNAALALGRGDIGTLAPGKVADLVLWDAESPAEIPYHYAANLVHGVVKAGRAYNPAGVQTPLG